MPAARNVVEARIPLAAACRSVVKQDGAVSDCFRELLRVLQVAGSVKDNCLAVVTSQTFNGMGIMFEYTQSRHVPEYFCFMDTAVRSGGIS